MRSPGSGRGLTNRPPPRHDPDPRLQEENVRSAVSSTYYVRAARTVRSSKGESERNPADVMSIHEFKVAEVSGPSGWYYVLLLDPFVVLSWALVE
jgi:hypothetical protein